MLVDVSESDLSSLVQAGNLITSVSPEVLSSVSVIEHDSQLEQSFGRSRNWIKTMHC
jgi:hypothetical protein